MSDLESTAAGNQKHDNNNDQSLDSLINSVTLTILDGKFFTVNEEKSSIALNSITAQCQLCLPNTEEIKGSAVSSSNYLSHLRKRHGDCIIKEYENYKKFKRAKLSQVNNNNSIEKRTTKFQFKDIQTQLDDNITDFVIDSMVPVRVVENHYFRKIVNDLQKNSKQKQLKIMSRFTLKRRIQKKFKDYLSELKKILSTEAEYICTTADIWSGKRKSFLGVTCHWISPKTLKRRSAALACRRFKGTHSYDKIAEMLNVINAEYSIDPSKVVATTTDNGSNFVKAFRIFGSQDEGSEYEYEDEIETELDEIEENECCNSIVNSDNIEDEEDIQHCIIDPRSKVEYNLVRDQEHEIQLKLYLPDHLRCASHTLNLVATSDVVKTMKSYTTLSVIHNRVLSKCNDLWNRASRPKSAEIIQEILNHTLCRPGQTRWNALYDAFKQILSIKLKSSELNKALELSNGLKDKDFVYIEEYLQCMKPLAQTLDILQEEDVYYGQLLPALISLRRKITSLETVKFKYVKPLVTSLGISVESRFEDILQFRTSAAKNAVIAAFSHPEFKKRWLRCINSTEHEQLLTQFKQAVVAQLEKLPEKTPESQNSEKRNRKEFYDFGSDSGEEGDDITDPNLNKASIEILRYFDDKRTDLEMLHSYPSIKKVFLQYNTPLPSSAPVERLFSYATMSSMPKSNRISDLLFEMKVVLKSNCLNKS